MESLYGKRNLNDWMLKQINELFRMNYQCYHYEQLTSFEGIKKLIDDKEFDCVYAVDEGRIVGFAGFYLRTIESDLVQECLLAHLLVDKSYRGRGLGTMLEECRLNILNQERVERVIYASCVERPKNSIYMKLNRQFFINGFRYEYRNVAQRKENAVILINTASVNKSQMISVSGISEMTKKLLKRGNPNILFSSDIEVESCYRILINKDEKIGRIVGRIVSDELSFHRISEIVLPKNFDNEYISIYVRPSIKGYGNIDRFLISQRFYPICYIPYIKDYYGVVEYQFLPDGIEGVLRDDNVSYEGKEFLKIYA